MPPNRGMNASNREIHAQYHRFKRRVESTFYKLPKKWEYSLRPPAFDASFPYTDVTMVDNSKVITGSFNWSDLPPTPMMKPCC